MFVTKLNGQAQTVSSFCVHFLWLILPISTRDGTSLQSTSPLSLYTFKIRLCSTGILFFKEIDLCT